MDVELQVIPDCPSAQGAHELLRRALDDIGLGAVAFHTTVITSDDEARASGFGGSPTFKADGRDVFASANPTTGLACRLYPTESGIRPLPDLVQLRRALRQAADMSRT